MCGIAGVSLTSERPVPAAMLRALADALRHRGPDGEGMVEGPGVALVHRRLSIIDVAGGAQPISDADEAVHIVANGEIYNYRPLQDALDEHGVALKTRSDTEPALHLYKAHGTGFVDHLNGMYALAIYDGRTGEVVLARDPFGIKPLYYAQTSEGIAFASEPAALIKAGWTAAEVETRALGAYFARQYVGGRHTLLKGIRRVLPGETLVLQKGEIVRRGRRLPALRPAAKAADGADAAFDRILEHAVRRHQQSEVPYGAFLSGGIDSSCMVLKMSQIAGPVNTFTIGFDSATVDDERTAAERLVRDLDVSHRGILFSEEDFWATLPKMCAAFDDLVADYAALPLLKLAREAAPSVKVVLSGEGGDEIFAGYGRYRRGWWDTLRRRPFRGRGGTAGYEALFDPAVFDDAVGADIPFDLNGFTPLQRRQAIDVVDWLPDDLLTKVDRCLMAYGIEGRVPYLDDDLAAFGFGLPDRCKVSGRHGKYLVKSWLSRQRPDLDVWARKRGFTVPIGDWLERKRPHLAAYLSAQEGVRAITKVAPLEAFFARPFGRKGAQLAFALLCFGLWHDIHIRGVAPRNAALGFTGEPGSGGG